MITGRDILPDRVSLTTRQQRDTDPIRIGLPPLFKFCPGRRPCRVPYRRWTEAHFGLPVGSTITAARLEMTGHKTASDSFRQAQAVRITILPNHHRLSPYGRLHLPLIYIFMLIAFPHDRSYESHSSFPMSGPPTGDGVPQIKHPSGPLLVHPPPAMPVRKRTDSWNFEPLPVGQASKAVMIAVKPITPDFGIIERYEW